MKKLILFFGICIFANFKTNAQQIAIYNYSQYPISVNIYDPSDCSYSLQQVQANSSNLCINTYSVSPNSTFPLQSGQFSCGSTLDYGFSVTITYGSLYIQSDYMMNDGNQYFYNNCSQTVSPLPPTTAVLVGTQFVHIWDVKYGSTDEIFVQ